MKRCLPMVWLIALLFAFPLVMTGIGSLLSPNELQQTLFAGSARIVLIPNHITLCCYAQLLIFSEGFLRAFWNSLVLVCVLTAGQTMVGMVSGYCLAKVRFPGRTQLLFLYLFTLLLPSQATLVTGYIQMHSLRLLDSWAAVALPLLFTPLSTLLFCFAVGHIPHELFEVTCLESQSFLVYLRHVVLPAVLPAAIAFMVFSFSQNWNLYELPTVMIKATALRPLSCLMNNGGYVPKEQIFAAAVLYMLPILALYALFSDHIKDGIVTREEIDIKYAKSNVGNPGFSDK